MLDIVTHREYQKWLRSRQAQIPRLRTDEVSDEEVIQAILSVPVHRTAVTYFNSTSGGSGNSSSARNLTINGVSSGDTVVVMAGMFNSSSATITVTDNVNAGNYATGADYGSGSQSLCLRYMKNSGAGNVQITVTPSTSVYMGLAMAVYSGADTTTPIHNVTAGNTGTGTAVDAGTPTVGAAGTMLVACACQGTGVISATAGGSATLRENENNGSTTEAVYVEDYANQSSGSDMTFTLASSATWLALAFSIQPPGGGGATFNPGWAYAATSGVLGTGIF